MSFGPLERLRASLAKDESFRVLQRLFLADGVKHWKGYATAFAFMGFMALSTGGMAWLMRDAVNSIFVHPTFWGVWGVALGVMALSVIKGASAYGQNITMARVGNRIVADNQKKAFDHLLGQEVSFYAIRHTAEISMRLQAGANAARDALNLVITSIGRDLLSLVVLVMVAVIQDPMLALVALVLMPAAVIGTRKLIKKAKNIFRKEFASGIKLSAISLEVIQGMRTVKAYTLEDTMRVRVHTYIDDVERAANKLVRTQAKSSPLMETLGGFAIGGVILYAGYNVMFAGKSPGEFFSVLTALLLAYEPAKRLARFNVDLAAHVIGAHMLFELLDMRAPEAEEKTLPDLPAGPGRVTFDQVEFGYRDNEKVLRGFDFVAEPGQTTALVGPSGGGKSTVISLIERFFTPSAGTVAIDGHDVTAFNRQSVRTHTALVSQDVYLFSGSVRENIGFGREGATEEEIVAAAKAAYAHDFIMGFEQGYDTPVGEHGAQLSGGQRQRIAIARAFLKNAPILLLDEATAALDSESEAEVQKALQKLQSSRTTIVIAHRLQTVVRADKICVVEQGRILESGRHDELMARRGRYYNFYQIQFAHEGEAGAEPQGEALLSA
ncbi:ABC transporter ATP-binding protein [Azorhizobium oxalatiphilum]|uniref:ABC transporter ATP-binding protein n=1 Tax=Azorhizobium oxalatiphilum TaxID=980631 RepID=A0A917F6G2_9HYPH|nr:ABC transporter ATP-binding protein [Azorhizobium oxalatiphilum]GGF55652.1 ABC transporter ATP-binding protein [Azorhizobium oxalatiphilum]